MRFINFCDELENGYININEIVNCHIVREFKEGNLYTLKLALKDNSTRVNRAIGEPDSYPKIAQRQTILISYLANDMVKIIDIDNKGKVSPRFYV